ncbi:MAG: Nif3-like dinuclear metal center hexameric protein [Clostridia bacterium]|nr:Nif3-like dinuclear metal center hexameric protein [Clostridia bacterium]
MNVRELYNYLDDRIPASLSCEWDNDGLMVEADGDREVKKVLISLDVTPDAVGYAVEGGFDVILSHHPLIFKPLKSVNDDSYISRMVKKLLVNGISVMSFHTRLDRVEGGVNDALAAVIGLTDIEPMPEIGRVGNLGEEVYIDDFVGFVRDVLGCEHVDFVGERPVYRVAVVGGDGKDNFADAVKNGADTYLTGSMSYNTMVDAAYMGINVIEAGHFQTEHPVCTVLAQTLSEQGIDCEIYYSDPIGTCVADNFVE